MSQQVGHKLQKCLNIAKCEIICLEAEEEGCIWGMEISIQTMSVSWKGFTIIHYLSISCWAMVHLRGSTETETDWSRVNSHLICVFGFGIAAAVRLILYKITKRMMNWWSFRQKPSRVWEINMFSSSKWRATRVTHSLSDYLTESKRYKWTCKGRLFHLTSHIYHVDNFI